MKKYNILVFPCGNENAKEVLNSLAPYEEFNVIGGSSEETIGSLLFNQTITELPYINDVNFINQLSKFIELYSIDFIIPTHDFVVEILAVNQDKLLAHCIVPNTNAAIIISDKFKTYKTFACYDFCPKIYENIPNTGYPIFAKKRVGRLAEGAQIIKDKNEANMFFKSNNITDYLISEYLDGKEYSVECFTNRNGELKFCEGREVSKQVRGLFLNSSSPENVESFRTIAETINRVLELRGLWYFQIKHCKGRPKLLEIAQKPNNTMALLRAKGVNLVLLTLLDILGLLELNSNKIPTYQSLEIYSKRQFINYFELNMEYNKIFFNLDTVFKHDKSKNLALINFIYQNKYKNKKNVGFSPRRQTKEILDNYNICESLFSELYDKELDYSGLTKDTIIIDDNIDNRSTYVFKGVVTFDTSCIEMLIDYRR